LRRTFERVHPELITLPGGFSIKTYGFFLMLGFLSAVWLAMRRAEQAKANPDRMLDLAFLCLIFGIGGARLFYVIHYWKTRFADVPNKFFAVINITEGGLEFLGGFLGAFAAIVVYCWWTRISLRLYLDLIAPSAMWGLAFGRIGCFFNGCCFGGLAVAAPGQPPSPRWAVQFPYGSPAQYRHWEDRKATVPAELIATSREAVQPILVPEAQLSMPVEHREKPLRALQEAKEAYEKAKSEDPGGKETLALQQQVAKAKKAAEQHLTELGLVLRAQKHPSRVNPAREMTVSELQELARQAPSAPVHPTQLYASGGALLLFFFLSAVLRYRRRHGAVVGLLLLLYPVQRILEELIRADNPHDVAGLTISQSISVAMLIAAAAYLWVLYRRLPEKSPLAVESEPPVAKPALAH